MSFPDVEEGRQYQLALRELILYRTGGADPHARAEAARLCRLATEVLADEQCREYLRLIRDRCVDFFSDDAHRRWQRSTLSGIYVLRLQLLRTVDALGLRLDAIEQSRSIPPGRSERPQML